MLDLLKRHPYEACTAFALNWLRALAESDYERATSMIDDYLLDVPLEKCFPKHRAGRSPLLHPDKFFEWSIRFIGGDKSGLSLDFEVPFAGDKYRPNEARFDFTR